MTEGEAAPAAVAAPGARNLLMRVVAALVLAPAAIAMAYAGGWLWTTLVTPAAHAAQLAAVARPVAYTAPMGVTLVETLVAVG